VHQSRGNPSAYVDWSPFFSALGKNTGLKTLSLTGNSWILDESLCTAMHNGIGMNETLESLEFDGVRVTDDNVAMWCRSLSFLRTNKALKSFQVDVLHPAKESCLSTFRIGIVTMLQETASLESISISNWNIIERMKDEEYIALITALQHNTTLKSLSNSSEHNRILRLTDNEGRQMAALFKKKLRIGRSTRCWLVGRCERHFATE
jgi:hypothetical protein